MKRRREIEDLLGAVLEEQQADDDPQDRQGQRRPLLDTPELSHVTHPSLAGTTTEASPMAAPCRPTARHPADAERSHPSIPNRRLPGPRRY
jgi:hypothetical protein